MRPFGHTSARLRGVAAFISLALTVAMFLLLRATSTHRPEAKRTVATVAVTIFPAKPVRVGAAPTPPETSAPKAGTRSAATARLRSTVSAPPAEPEAAAGPSTSAPVEALPASAPLRLDPQTISRAIAASEGNIQHMARRSGAELDSPRASRSELLAGTGADKGVPDCLAPNAGGSLLSAPILLLLAIQGKCK